MTAGFLLDTNVVSELRKGARADAGVLAWFEHHSTDQLWLSVERMGKHGVGHRVFSFRLCRRQR